MGITKGNRRMYIPSYHIHNVLKVYSKQVSQSRISERQKEIGSKPSVDKIEISSEGKRKMVIDKVAAGIVDRITQVGPESQVDHEIVNHLQNELGRSVTHDTEGSSDFVYNVIDDNNQKTTNTLSVEGSDLLNGHVAEPAGGEVDKQMEK
jgi:hypothetical protein